MEGGRGKREEEKGGRKVGRAETRARGSMGGREEKR